MNLYTQEDIQHNATQMKGVLTQLGALSILLVAALAASLVVRAEWLTIILTILWGGALIFLWEMKLSPVLAYRRYLRSVAQGMTRTAEGVLVSLAEEGTFKEGVFFSVMILNVDEKMDPEGERLFYVDRCKTRPALVPGDRVRVTSHGNYVVSWEKITA